MVVVKFAKRVREEDWGEKGDSHKLLTVVNGLSLLWNFDTLKTSEKITNSLGEEKTISNFTGILQLDSLKREVSTIDDNVNLKWSINWFSKSHRLGDLLDERSINSLENGKWKTKNLPQSGNKSDFFILSIEESDVDPIAWLTTKVKRNTTRAGLLNGKLHANCMVDGDVELRCVDGSLRAHSIVLTAQSEYFSRLFHFNESKNAGKNSTNVVKFKTTPVAAAAVVLRFLYCGDKPTDLGGFGLADVDELLRLAAQIEPPHMDGLWAAVEIDLLRRTILDADVSEALGIADRHGLAFLRNVLLTRLAERPSDYAHVYEMLPPEIKAEIWANAQARNGVVQDFPYK